jgi:hypothetical protein
MARRCTCRSRLRGTRKRAAAPLILPGVRPIRRGAPPIHLEVPLILPVVPLMPPAVLPILPVVPPMPPAVLPILPVVPPAVLPILPVVPPAAPPILPVVPPAAPPILPVVPALPAVPPTRPVLPPTPSRHRTKDNRVVIPVDTPHLTIHPPLTTDNTQHPRGRRRWYLPIRSTRAMTPKYFAKR